MPVTLQNLDEVFTYHEWSPEQRARGNAIREKAKVLSRGILARMNIGELLERQVEFYEAIDASAIAPPAEKTDLYAYAQNRRMKALTMANEVREMLKETTSNPDSTDQAIVSFINQTVMMANSAITFEASTLVRETPQVTS